MTDRSLDQRRAQVEEVYGAEADIERWANRCALNPARVEPSQRNPPAGQDAAARLVAVADRGLLIVKDELADLFGSCSRCHQHSSRPARWLSVRMPTPP